MNSNADRISPSIPLQARKVCRTSAKPGQPATGHSTSGARPSQPRAPSAGQRGSEPGRTGLAANEGVTGSKTEMKLPQCQAGRGTRGETQGSLHMGRKGAALGTT